MALFLPPCVNPLQQFRSRFVDGISGDELIGDGAGEEGGRGLVQLPLGLHGAKPRIDALLAGLPLRITNHGFLRPALGQK